MYLGHVDGMIWDVLKMFMLREVKRWAKHGFNWK